MTRSGWCCAIDVAGLLAVVRDQHLEALHRQVDLDEPGDVHVVVDDQDQFGAPAALRSSGRAPGRPPLSAAPARRADRGGRAAQLAVPPRPGRRRRRPRYRPRTCPRRPRPPRRWCPSAIPPSTSMRSSRWPASACRRAARTFASSSGQELLAAEAGLDRHDQQQCRNAAAAPGTARPACPGRSPARPAPRPRADPGPAPTGFVAASTWKVTLYAPASAYPGAQRSGSTIIRWQSNGSVVRLAAGSAPRPARWSGSGTKWLSMTSTCSQSARLVAPSAPHRRGEVGGEQTGSDEERRSGHRASVRRIVTRAPGGTRRSMASEDRQIARFSQYSGW